MMTFLCYSCPCLCSGRVGPEHSILVAEKFRELEEQGVVPVCLFPTRKQCNQLNEQILARLDSETCELYCLDEVDETKSANKWHKTAAEQLVILNKDCNNTDGFLAVVSSCWCTSYAKMQHRH